MQGGFGISLPFYFKNAFYGHYFFRDKGGHSITNSTLIPLLILARFHSFIFPLLLRCLPLLRLISFSSYFHFCFGFPPFLHFFPLSHFSTSISAPSFISLCPRFYSGFPNYAFQLTHFCPFFYSDVFFMRLFLFFLPSRLGSNFALQQSDWVVYLPENQSPPTPPLL